MKMPAWVERVQRREYFRVPINEPTQVMAYARDTGAAMPICAMLLDLSGTGARIATRQSLSPNMFVRIHLPCDTLGGAGMDARVLQCDSRRSADGLDHVSQCRFLAVTEETTSALLQACWKRERDHHLGMKS
jgi:c-di-GMP-binding flagellar brake protein YcgR